MSKLTGRQIADAALEGWANLGGVLATRIATDDFASALALVDAIGAAAERANHHPDLSLGWGRVDVRLTSHDTGGVTQRDVDLARAISELAEDAGLETVADGVSRVELALDTPDLGALMPFWQAALRTERPAGGGADDDGDELVDPAGDVPLVWFQKSGGDDPGRQRWHLDVWVDPTQVQPRIEAAVAAGGTVDSAEHAPSFWVLADPEGNKVCLCTWQERG